MTKVVSTSEPRRSNRSRRQVESIYDEARDAVAAGGDAVSGGEETEEESPVKTKRTGR
jgi:hypothetical protein